MPDYFSLYNRHVKNLTGRGPQKRGNCPFKVEKTPKDKAFKVNTQTGLHFCTSCGRKGNAISFAKYFDEDPTPYYDIKPNSIHIDLQQIKKAQLVLESHPQNARSTCNTDVQDLLKLGWSLKNDCFVIPIFNEEGEIVSIKKHKQNQTSGSFARLYPAHLLEAYDSTYLIICEGEPDVWTLLSNGFQVVTSTGGATGVPADISCLKKFKRIYLCPDFDDAGETFIDKWGKQLKKLNPYADVRVCDLFGFVDEKGDVSAYFENPKYSRRSFISDVLHKSRKFKQLLTDIPDLLRSELKSDWFRKLKVRDKLVYLNLLLRASRYRTAFENFNGMRLIVHPGEWVSSPKRFAEFCGDGLTPKMVKSSWDFFDKEGKIKLETLLKKKGHRVTLLSWVDDNGQSKWSSKTEQDAVSSFPIFSIPNLPIKTSK